MGLGFRVWGVPVVARNAEHVEHRRPGRDLVAVWDLGLRVKGLGFGVRGLWFRV